MRPGTRRTLAALALTGAGTALVVGYRTTDPALMVQGGTGDVAAGDITTPAPTSTSSGSDSGGSAAGGTSPASGTDTASAYQDGTWTGSAVREPWGTFQVQVTISGGVITNVEVVSEPPDGHSQRINSRAIPLLTQSAVDAQDANIDMVSGATWTSDSYATSLQAALDDAAA